MEIEPIYIAYASLIAMAMLPIYFGSHLAVEEDAKAGADSERLSSADAYWFPVIGSVALFTFYLVFKFFPKEYVNYLLTVYFGVFGTFAVTKIAVRIAQVVVPNKCEMKGHFHLVLEKPSSNERLIDVNITWLNTICAILSTAFTCYYVWSKHWVASNIFGLAFATSAISMIQLDTFATGMILLAGLFVYDIFWVFGTDVMVSVAKSFDIPVKLLFPRGADAGFSMLGLGDIVIPGVYVALCLKFDRHLCSSSKKGNSCNKYFGVSLAFYFAGLATTMYVMHTFKAAQPALLYLSPACILSTLLVAAGSGELSQVFKFTTEKPAFNKDAAKEETVKASPKKTRKHAKSE